MPVHFPFLIWLILILLMNENVSQKFEFEIYVETLNLTLNSTLKQQNCIWIEGLKSRNTVSPKSS